MDSYWGGLLLLKWISNLFNTENTISMNVYCWIFQWSRHYSVHQSRPCYVQRGRMLPRFNVLGTHWATFYQRLLLLKQTKEILQIRVNEEQEAFPCLLLKRSQPIQENEHLSFIVVLCQRPWMPLLCTPKATSQRGQGFINYGGPLNPACQTTSSSPRRAWSGHRHSVNLGGWLCHSLSGVWWLGQEAPRLHFQVLSNPEAQ